VKLKFFALTLIFSYSMIILIGCASMSKTKPPEAFKNPVAVLQTNKGKIVMELYPESAPKTVENFKKLISEKFYDGLTFHRYVKDFLKLSTHKCGRFFIHRTLPGSPYVKQPKLFRYNILGLGSRKASFHQAPF